MLQKRLKKQTTSKLNCNYLYVLLATHFATSWPSKMFKTKPGNIKSKPPFSLEKLSAPKCLVRQFFYETSASALKKFATFTFNHQIISDLSTKYDSFQMTPSPD
jgi:hypothetical protein